MDCNYKVKIKDIQNKYTFKIFMAGADTSQIEQEIGNLENLTTTTKTDLVSAINEVDGNTTTNATAISGLQSGKEDKSNKVTSISSSSTDTQYPSAKCVYDSQTEQNNAISTLDTKVDNSVEELEALQEENSYLQTITQGLYNALPKATTTGESGTLNNTCENAPLKIGLGANTEQDSTSISGGDEYDSPSPDHPQRVKVVSGDNTIEVVGKNLYNQTDLLNVQGWTKSNDYYTGGTYDLRGYWKNTKPIYSSFKENTQYTFSWTGYLGTATNVRIKFIYTDGTNTDNMAKLTSSEANVYGTSTLNKTIDHIEVDYGTSGTIFIKDIQLEESSTASTYEPYTKDTYEINLGDIEYNAIGDYKDEFVKSSGKNLFNESTLDIGHWLSSSNVLSANANACVSDFIKVEPNTPIVFSAMNKYSSTGYATINQYDSNKEWIKGNEPSTPTNTKFEKTYTTESNCAYVKVSILYYTSTSEIQLEYGSSSTLYEPYGIQWFLRKNIGKVVFDGSEDWNRGSNGAYYVSVTIDYLKSSGITCMSNYFIGDNNGTGSSGVADNKIAFYYGTNTTKEFFCAYRDKLTTDDFKTWLNTHNTLVLYVLATPQTITLPTSLQNQLNEIEKALAKDSQTNVSQINNDIPFILDLETITKVSGE